MRFPDQRLAVTALCNLANINPSELTRRVAEVYLGGEMRRDSTGTAPKAIAISAGELSRYAGVYWNPLTDDVWRLQARGDTLVLQVGGGISLTPVGTDRFVGPGGAELTFTGQSNSIARLRVVVEGERPRELERREPFDPPAAALASYAGRYYSEEINTAYDLVVRGDTLVAVSRRGAEYPLEPLSADLFRGRGLGTVRFERDGKKRVTALRVSTGRVRRLKFERTGQARG